MVSPNWWGKDPGAGVTKVGKNAGGMTVDEQQPLNRRKFLGEALALGAGLLASVAWALAPGDGQSVEARDASPKPKPSGTASGKPPVKPGASGSPRRPDEGDYRRPGGVPMPPRTPAPTPTPTPKETDHVPMPGGAPVCPPSSRPKK